MGDVGVWVKLMYWENRLWLSLELFVGADSFKDSLGRTKALATGQLGFLSLIDYIQAVPEIDRMAFVENLRRFVLPDDAAVQFDLSWLTATAGPWFDTGRQSRAIKDFNKFAEQNESENSLVDPLEAPTFCAQFNANLRRALASPEYSNDPRGLAAALSMGRDIVADGDSIFNRESPELEALDLLSLTPLRPRPILVTNVQSLNGLMIGLPAAFDPSSGLPTELHCRIVLSASQQETELTFDISQVPSQLVAYSFSASGIGEQYPSYPFEQVAWTGLIDSVEIRNPHREVVAARTWIDYEHAVQSGVQHCFVARSVAPLRNDNEATHLDCLAVLPTEQFPCKWKNAVWVEGKLSALSGTTGSLGPWRLLPGVTSRALLAGFHRGFGYTLAVLQLYARKANGDLIPVNATGSGRRNWLALGEQDEWQFLLRVDSSHDPSGSDTVGHVVVVTHPDERERSDDQPQITFGLFGTGCWNAIWLETADPYVSQKAIRVAPRTRVTFTPTNSTESVDVQLLATSPTPLHDFAGTPLGDDPYYVSLLGDARSFAGLEMELSPVRTQFAIERAFPVFELNSGSERKRRYRVSLAPVWNDPTASAQLSAARERIALVEAGSYKVTGRLRDMHGRWRSLGLLEDGSSASVDIPWRIGTFPPALSSLTVQDQTKIMPWHVLRGNLQFLITVEFEPSPFGQSRLFKIRISFNEALLFNGLDDERLGQVWNSLADVVLATKVVVTFFELELDNSAGATGYLRAIDAGSDVPISLDITAKLQRIARELIASGKPRNRSVDLELPQTIIVRFSDTSSYFACGMQVLRNPERLAVMDLAGSSDVSPVLTIQNPAAGTRSSVEIADDERDFGNAFARYQGSLRSACAPLMGGSSTADEGLSWTNTHLSDCSGVTFTARSLWPIPMPGLNVDHVRMVGFVCAAPLLSNGGKGQRMFENIGEALRLIKQGELGPISETPAALELLRFFDETIFGQGPLTVNGYEDTAAAPGAWTRLLSVLAGRMDVLHGNLGVISAPAAQALPSAIPFHDFGDQSTLGSENGQYSAPIGQALRDSLVKFWRRAPELAWNQTAAWVSTLSHRDGLDLTTSLRPFTHADVRLSRGDNSTKASGRIPLSGQQVALAVTPLSRKTFVERVALVSAGLTPIQIAASAPHSLPVSHFRVPEGDLSSRQPVCEVLLPSTAELATPVLEASGIESVAMQDPGVFLAKVATIIHSKESLKASQLLKGEVIKATASDSAVDVLCPLSFTSANLPDVVEAFMTWRAFMISVSGDTKLEHPFARDRFLVCRVPESRAHGGSSLEAPRNFWERLSTVDIGTVKTVVEEAIRDYGNGTSQLEMAANDLSTTIGELAGYLETVSTQPVDDSSILARVSVIGTADRLEPKIEFTGQTKKWGFPSQVAVVLLRSATGASEAPERIRMFVMLGFSVTSASELQLVHDRDANWKTDPSGEFMSQLFSQTQVVDLPGMLRPAAFNYATKSTSVVNIYNQDLPWKMFDSILRLSGDVSLAELARVLDLESVASGNETRFRHLTLRLSIETEIPQATTSIDPIRGVVQRPLAPDKSMRWTYGLTSPADQRMAVMEVVFPHAATTMHMRARFTLLSKHVSGPVLQVDGILLQLFR